MPKPLFTKLVAICAIGFFCVLFGCVYSIHTKDPVMMVMSLLLGLCFVIRFLLLYSLIRKNSYVTMTGTCLKREPALLGTTQQIHFQCQDKEYQLTLEKQVKLQQGHHYCLYYKISPHSEAALSTHDFLGFEELSLPEE